MWHLAYWALVVPVHDKAGGLAQMPWGVPETSAADFGFVSLLKNITKNKNNSVILIQVSTKFKYMFPQST